MAAARQVKSVNPGASVVVWMDTMLVYTGWNWSPDGALNKTLNTSLNPDIKGPCSTGHFRPAEFLEGTAAGRSLLLKNSSGQKALQKWSNCHVYDHSQAAGRQYWTEMCLNMTDSGFIDGCGADFSAMGGNRWSDHTPQAIAKDLDLDLAAATAWGNGHRQMMKDTTAALGDGLLIGKDYAELGDHVNAVLQEGCSASNSTIVMLQGLGAKAKALKTRLVYQCHTTTPSQTGNLAAFLIGAADDHYLTIGGWVDDSPSNHWSPLFDKPLGEPTADGVYDASTATWRRSFSSGTAVTFNARTNAGTIEWGAHSSATRTKSDDGHLHAAPPTLPPLPTPGYPGIRSRFADLPERGLRMHYLEAVPATGTAEPRLLALMHGYPEIAYSFRKQLEPLAARGFHVVAMDHRCVGRTTGCNTTYSAPQQSYAIANMAADTLALVEHIITGSSGRLRSAVAIGSDFGSGLAVTCAQLFPKTFTSVVHMSAPHGAPVIYPNDAQLALLDPPRKHYQQYYRTAAANDDMMNSPQGLHDFYRGYTHFKSADWNGTRSPGGDMPHRLNTSVVPEYRCFAELPHYCKRSRSLCVFFRSLKDVAAQT